MTTHELISQIHYRWVAKNLHGVHSPFVYAFNEQLLAHRKQQNPIAIDKQLDALPAKYQQLIARMQQHYALPTLYTAAPTLLPIEQPIDCLLLKKDKPGDWIRMYHTYAPHMAEQSCIIVAGIHTTARHSAKWKRLHNNPSIKLSIDLFGIGILFKRNKLRDKYHYVLQY